MNQDQVNFQSRYGSVGNAQPMSNLVPQAGPNLLPDPFTSDVLPKSISDGQLQAQLTVILGFLQSSNASATLGWKLNYDGSISLNGNPKITGPIVSSHFIKGPSIGTSTIWQSDGATPQGSLSGTSGDWCMNGPSSKGFYCTGTTNWSPFNV